MTRGLVHRLLSERGVKHGFGTRQSSPPAGCVLARQVHGVRVARVVPGSAAPGEADALVGAGPGVLVGVRTADCVPVLLADAGGSRVAAVHAGWKGLAAGVIPAALAALRAEGCAPSDLVAVVGPHIGACCYEVDAPVLEALARFGGELAEASTPTRPGHVRLDLGRLARGDLLRSLSPDAVARIGGCTCCEAECFHSYRRDGERSGRLVHWVATVRSDEAST